MLEALEDFIKSSNSIGKSAIPPTSFTDFIQKRHMFSKKLGQLIPQWRVPSMNCHLGTPNKITKSVRHRNEDSICTNLALLKRGMSPKKCHEVSSFTNFIHEQFNRVLTKPQNFLIDIGSGLGYLDQFLWYVHGYRVIGVESNSGHILSAEKRTLSLNFNSDDIGYEKMYIFESETSYESMDFSHSMITP